MKHHRSFFSLLTLLSFEFFIMSRLPAFVVRTKTSCFSIISLVSHDWKERNLCSSFPRKINLERISFPVEEADLIASIRYQSNKFTSGLDRIFSFLLFLLPSSRNWALSLIKFNGWVLRCTFIFFFESFFAFSSGKRILFPPLPLSFYLLPQRKNYMLSAHIDSVIFAQQHEHSMWFH